MKPLTITFVCEALGNRGNGTSNSAVQYATELEKLGNSVRLVGVGAPDFPLPERYIPLVTPISRRQQMRFAHVDDAVLRRAIAGADVVHCYLPFALEKRALRIAHESGIPVTAGFHLQPENILYSAGPLRFIPHASDAVYRMEYDYFFRHIQHVHVPTQLGAQLLREHGFTNHLHVISNGYEPRFCPAPPSSASQFSERANGMRGSHRRFRIIASGRLAGEKDQETLLRAVALSRHRDQIDVRIAGKGPLHAHLLRLASSIGLSHVNIAFIPHDHMPDFLRSGDLLVHCSIADLESISVIEAMACGLVPVIADSPLSAAGQFSLCSHSSFPVGNARVLAKRIDWWIEHPDQLAHWSTRYAQHTREHYSLQACVTAFEKMEREAIADAHVNQDRR